MVAAALDGLPEDLGNLMRNVAVLVEHGDGPPGLLGLYEGVPLTVRSTHYAGVLPDRITIYRRAICANAWSCGGRGAGAQDRHPRGRHHFGISDDRLRELGW